MRLGFRRLCLPVAGVGLLGKRSVWEDRRALSENMRGRWVYCCDKWVVEREKLEAVILEGGHCVKIAQSDGRSWFPDGVFGLKLEKQINGKTLSNCSLLL